MASSPKKTKSDLLKNYCFAIDCSLYSFAIQYIDLPLSCHELQKKSINSIKIISQRPTTKIEQP